MQTEVETMKIIITAPNVTNLSSENYLNKLSGKTKKLITIIAQKDLSGFIKYSQASSPSTSIQNLAINLFYNII